jgi:hypothetical protein
MHIHADHVNHIIVNVLSINMVLMCLRMECSEVGDIVT